VSRSALGHSLCGRGALAGLDPCGNHSLARGGEKELGSRTLAEGGSIIDVESVFAVLNHGRERRFARDAVGGVDSPNLGEHGVYSLHRRHCGQLPLQYLYPEAAPQDNHRVSSRNTTSCSSEQEKRSRRGEGGM
jgi:hypothetical protein